MEKLVRIIVAVVFGVTIAKPNNSKQVNFALETVLKFDDHDVHDRSPGLAAIENVQNFLDQIKAAIQDTGRNTRKTTSKTTFSDFVLKAAKILRKYNDNDIKEARAALENDARRYMKNVRFYEYFGDSHFRRFLSNRLDEFKHLPVARLRRYLDIAIKAIENLEQRGDVNDLLEFGNYLFAGAKDKFDSALNKLESRRRSSKVDLTNVLRDTLRSLVVDHYFNLDANIQTELLNMVRHYWKAFGRNKNFDRSKTEIQDRNKDTLIYYVRQKNKSDPSNSKENRKYRDNMKSKYNKKVLEINKRKTAHANFKALSSQLENEEDFADDNGKSDVLTNVAFRSQTSIEESDQFDETEGDVRKPQELVIQHSNVIDVGLSRMSPGRFNISFEPAKRYKPSSANRNRFMSRKQFNAVTVPALLTDGGLGEDVSIETSIIEDENHLRRRKSKHSTENYTNDIHTLIEHIEEDIEDVKEKIEFVKSLSGIKTKKCGLTNDSENCSESTSVEGEDIFWSGRFENETTIAADKSQVKSDDLRRVNNNNELIIEETTKANDNVTTDKTIETKKVNDSVAANKEIQLVNSTETKLDQNNIDETTVIKDHNSSELSNIDGETDFSSYLQDVSHGNPKGVVISEVPNFESSTVEPGTLNNLYLRH